MQRRNNEQALAVGIKTRDERAVDGLPKKERLLEWHHDQIAPRFIRRIAHPDDRTAGFPVERSRGADDKIVVRLPGENVTGIRGLKGQCASFEIHSVDVESRPIAQVECNEERPRMLRSRS